jgi:hypothetical protein
MFGPKPRTIPKPVIPIAKPADYNIGLDVCPRGHKLPRGWIEDLDGPCPKCMNDDREEAKRIADTPQGPAPLYLTIREVSTGKVTVFKAPGKPKARPRRRRTRR